MRLFGFEITRSPKLLSTVDARGNGGWISVIRESFPGAWQRNLYVESPKNILAFAAVYACVALISNDIAKLRLKLCENVNGIWNEITANSPFLPVLRKPNRYQTRIQFLSQWVTTLLLHGNTYVIKERDQRGIVTALYILDSPRVKLLIADDGGVYYEIAADALPGVEKNITVPASEIIHDRCITLWHPLVGVTPIYACGAAASQGIKIQNNSATFFQNMSRPSGILTAPGRIDPETAARLKQDMEAAMSGANLGRLLIASDGMKYEAMTISPEQAQLIEQQKWTVEDVARAFGVPLYKLQAGNPTFTNGVQFDQDYYKQTLQAKIEAIELLLDEGLSLPPDYGVELDTEGLLRMDPKSQAETNEIEIRSAAMTPNEARFMRNRPAAKGGDSPMIQQQNYSLEAIAKRDAQPDPFGTAPKPAKEDEDETDEVVAELSALGATLPSLTTGARPHA